jgi:hypothetical protein
MLATSLRADLIGGLLYVVTRFGAACLSCS